MKPHPRPLSKKGKPHPRPLSFREGRKGEEMRNEKWNGLRSKVKGQFSILNCQLSIKKVLKSCSPCKKWTPKRLITKTTKKHEERNLEDGDPDTAQYPHRIRNFSGYGQRVWPAVLGSEKTPSRPPRGEGGRELLNDQTTNFPNN